MSKSNTKAAVSIEALRRLLGTNQSITKTFGKCAREGDVEGLKILLAMGQDIDAASYVHRHEESCSALVQAIERGQVETVKYLIKSGADVNKTALCDVPLSNWAPNLWDSQSQKKEIMGRRLECVKLVQAAQERQQKSDCNVLGNQSLLEPSAF